MDEKSNARKEVIDFITKYKKFEDELKGMNESRNRFEDKADTDFEMMTWRFKKTVEIDVNKAWDRLTTREKEDICQNHPVVMKIWKK